MLGTGQMVNSWWATLQSEASRQQLLPYITLQPGVKIGNVGKVARATSDWLRNAQVFFGLFTYKDKNILSKSALVVQWELFQPQLRR
jgi:hypothetical protein